MRAQSIYDREGNSYRYARQEKRIKEMAEREAQTKRWDDIYQKALPKSEKEHKID
jgi:Asp-tRNA(Asn)/Glu-tRNA(Gln) amidotransferase B subunit